MGRYLQSRDCEIVVPGPSWREIFVRKLRILPKSEKRSPSGKNPGGDECTSSSLRSENSEMKSAVETTPPWKAWKTQKNKASFPLFPPGLEIRQKTKASDFHISTAPAAKLISLSKDKT